jgi:hypothetical protein
MRSLFCCRVLVLAALAAAACRVADLVRAPAGGLTFSVQPAGGETDEPITPPVEVTVYNDAGAPDSTLRTVTIALNSNPSDATLSGVMEAQTVNGVAVFSNLRIDQPGSDYSLRAAVDGGAAASEPFDIARPPAVQLIFTVQPSNASANQPITPAIEVTALAGDGDPVPWFNGAITLALAPNGLGAAATGTLTVNAAGGVARFTNVRVDRIGLDYRLTAAFAGSATARTSDAFAVGP